MRVVFFLFASLLAAVSGLPVRGAVNVQIPGTDRRILNTPLQTAFPPNSPIANGINQGRVCNIVPGTSIACLHVVNNQCRQPVTLPRDSLYIRAEEPGFTEYLWQRVIQTQDEPVWNQVCNRAQGLTFSATCNNGQQVSFFVKGPVRCG